MAVSAPGAEHGREECARYPQAEDSAKLLSIAKRFIGNSRYNYQIPILNNTHLDRCSFASIRH